MSDECDFVPGRAEKLFLVTQGFGVGMGYFIELSCNNPRFHLRVFLLGQKANHHPMEVLSVRKSPDHIEEGHGIFS